MIEHVLPKDEPQHHRVKLCGVNKQTAMAKKRASTVTVENAIAAFRSKVKLGPEFVCMCCHRMMYKQTVIPYTRGKYTKASHELLEQVFCAKHNHIR